MWAQSGRLVPALRDLQGAFVRYGPWFTLLTLYSGRGGDTPIADMQQIHSPLDEETEAKVRAILDDFEIVRRKRMGQFIVCCALAVVLAATIAAVATAFGKPSGPAVWILMAGLVLAHWWLLMLWNDFKDQVLPPILAQFGFQYARRGHKVQLEYFKALLPQYQGAYLEDHFWGERDGIAMSMAELVLTNSTGNDSSVVFDGLIAEFDFPKTVGSAVYAKSNRKLWGKSIEALWGAGDRVKLENAEFERAFDVYSRDQVLARYIFTPTMMERFVALSRSFPGVQAVFEEKKVRLVLPGGPDLFLPDGLLKPIETTIANRFVRDMRIVFEFVDALKLDLETKV